MSMRIPFFGQHAKREERRLAAATFVIGIGVMAVEITASRLLAPYFGASMYVWTSLIVTVLLALSFGYHLGGNAAAKGVNDEAVGFLCCVAAALLVLGMVVIPHFSGAVSGLLVGVSSATVALFVGSLMVAMVVFATPVFLMAMAAPIILKEWSALGDVGAVSGRYFAISTAGSVIGTVAPTLVLVPLLGARSTMYAVAAMFMLLAAFLLPLRRRLVAALAASLVLAAMVMPHGSPKSLVMERESPYQLIRVAQTGDGRRLLVFNEGSGIQSVYVPGGGRTDFYFDYAGLLPLLRPAGKRTHKAVIVGFAGGSVAARYRSFAPDRDVSITGVEVDPAVIDTARKYFGVNDADVRLVNEDGRMFFANTRETFDVEFIDAYSTQLYIPPHLATGEFFALAKSRLVKDGVFSMNVNAPSEDSRLLKAMANTVASQFRHTLVIPIGHSWNHIIVASDAPFDLANVAYHVPDQYSDVKASLLNSYEVTYDARAEVFTDDRSPIEYLTDGMILQQAWQKSY